MLTSGTLADARLSSNVPLKDAANTFTAAQTVAGTLKVRQSGGTPGTDEVQVSHDGTNGLIRSMDGQLQLQSYWSGSSFRIDGDTFRFWGNNNSNDLTIANGGIGTPIFQLGGANCYMMRTTSFEMRSDGSLSWQDSTNAAAGTVDTRLTRPTAGVVQLSRLGTNGSAGGLSFAGPSSTGTLRDVGLIQGGFSDSTDATRAGQLSLGAYYTGTLYEGIRVRAASGLASVLVPSGLEVGTAYWDSSVAFSVASNRTWLFNMYTGAGTHRASLGTNGFMTIGPALLAESTMLSLVCNAAGVKGLAVRGAASQSANLIEWQNSAGSVLSAFKANAAWQPAALADADAANGTVYYSTTASKLVFKDSGGVVSALY